ncbi:hypothetical protein FQN54_004406 [Arachnomyces sp. PD_36]|nr:hypothetical protein FQN54_004406 [Arachnomyces sp. PD_36]
MSQGLSLLPPELAVNILQSLSSTRDLNAIIRASSQFYRIFSTYRHSILTTLLLDALSREAEADFILAYRAQRIWEFVPEGSYDLRAQHTGDKNLLAKLSEESIPVLDEFKSGKCESLLDLTSDHALLLDIWKFYTSFEHFMNCYSTSALSNLRQSNSGETLSSTERTRLQRAFFRLEIYTCLFQITQLDYRGTPITAPSSDLASRFVTKLHPWEAEEMFSVAQFYIILVEKLCDRIEEDLVKTVKDKMVARAVGNLEGETREPGGTIDHLDWHAINWFEKSHKSCYRSKHIEFLVSRGVRSVRKLMSVPFRIARKMVLGSDLLARQPAFPNFTQEHRSYVDRYWGNKEEGREEWNGLDENSPGLCNFGWLWAGGTCWTINIPVNYELRNKGYVFWDKARLMKSKLFKSHRKLVGSLFKFPTGHQEHSKRPGVGSKLRNIIIPYRDISELADEYTFPVGYVINWRD